MSKPSKREFADAIISSSPNRVQHLIDQGYDVNLPLFDDAIDAYDPNVEDFEPGSEEIIALSSGENACTMAYPLHVAVVTLYHEAMKKCGSNEYGVRQLIRIIKILLANGFWGYGCGDVLILNASGYDWVSFYKRHGVTVVTDNQFLLHSKCPNLTTVCRMLSGRLSQGLS